MAPDDQVKEGVKKRLRQVVGGSTLGPVLVQHHQVEPFTEGFLWPKHLHLQRKGKEIGRKAKKGARGKQSLREKGRKFR